MHKILLKVVPLKNEVALIKLIRLNTLRPISEIKQDIECDSVVLSVPYSELDELKKLRTLVEQIINLHSEVRLFLDTEEDEINVDFLDNAIASQEETIRYFESIDEL